MKHILMVCATAWLIALWLMCIVYIATPKCHAAGQSVTYHVRSTQPGNPTLVHYQASSGEEVYDALNWGNRDGDTLPWTLLQHDVGTPRLMAVNHKSTQPWPTLSCTITVNGMQVAHNDGVGTVQCEVAP